MKQLTVVYANGAQAEFWCASAEPSSDFLRLYGEPDPDNPAAPTIVGQFRLKGDGAIVGWYFSTVAFEEGTLMPSGDGHFPNVAQATGYDYSRADP